MWPPSSRLGHAVATVSPLLIVATSTALAQRGPGSEFATGTGPVTSHSIVLEAGTAAVVTLVVGGLMIVLAPGGTRSLTDQVLEMPGTAFLVGFLGTAATFLVAFVLALTRIGIVLAVPLLLIYAVLGFVGSELGLLTVGRLVADDWLPALAIAVVVSAFVGGVPYLGGAIGFIVFSIGIGVIVMRVLDE